MRLVDLQKGMISQKPTYRQKNHASRTYILLNPNYSRVHIAVNIVSSLRHIVSSKIPHHIFCSNPKSPKYLKTDVHHGGVSTVTEPTS